MIMIMITKKEIVVAMIKTNNNKNNINNHNNSNRNGVTLPCKSDSYSVYSKDRLMAVDTRACVALIFNPHGFPLK